MNTFSLRRWTGLLLMAGAILLLIPYYWLVINFDYPDVLRQPAGDILTRFQAGGDGLIFVWLAFAWSGLPLLAAILLLRRALGQEKSTLLEAAMVMGVISFLTQAAGLLRWVFVVPVLAHLYTDPAATEASREAAVVSFQAIHQYGGVLLGEHLGQLFTIAWTVLISLALLRATPAQRWLAWLGLAGSAVYFLAQAELLATVMPDFPVWGLAGLVGSLLWLLWLFLLGLSLVRQEGELSLAASFG
jgi:hypothetical protein